MKLLRRMFYRYTYIVTWFKQDIMDNTTLPSPRISLVEEFSLGTCIIQAPHGFMDDVIDTTAEWFLDTFMSM